MDEYSQSAHKTPKAAAKAREREMAAQMKKLLQLDDEELLVKVLKDDYGLTPGSPQFAGILQIWRSQQRK